MTASVAVALVLGGVLVAYVLTGLADFGGGVWDLVARGPSASEQRRAIARAIGPIWEANHVWLIVAIVLVFVCFPSTFAALSIALHVPLALLLVGVVLRGSAFVFRAYDSRRDDIQRRWSVVFAAASTGSPVLLGMVVGAVASGRIHVTEAGVEGGYFAPWLAPFPVAVGLLTLAIAAFLAAVYLTLETRRNFDLQEAFRRKGLGAAAAVFVLAWVAFFLARTGAPEVWHGLWAAPWSLPFQIVVGLCGLAAIAALASRRYAWARALAAAEAAFVVAGWGLAQWPYTLPPSLTVYDAAPEVVSWTTLTVLGIGGGPLAITYAWLMRIFDKTRAEDDPPPVV